MEDPRIPHPSTMTPANPATYVPDRRVLPPARETLSWLRSRHPRTLTWYGHATGRWWAYSGGRLLEAIDPVELDRAITMPMVWPWPRGAGR